MRFIKWVSHIANTHIIQSLNVCQCGLCIYFLFCQFGHKVFTTLLFPIYQTDRSDFKKIFGIMT